MTTKAKPIPDGFHTITPYLTIRDAARAIEYYKKAFGARELVRMASPDGQRIMHAELKIGDSLLMLCDECPDMGARSPQALGGTPAALHLYVENVDQTFDQAVRAGAQPIMPVMDMFWGDRYGKLRDPFGHEWGLATHQRDLTSDEMKKAAAAAFSKMPAGAGKS